MTRRCPRVAVDIFAINDNLEFILISRKNEPFKNYWALPGGFIEYGETAEQAAIREMKEETGLDVQVIDLVGVYSDPKRDPRGHVISITFLAKIIGGTLKASTDAKIAKFFKKPPEKLAFDHKKIIEDALFKLKTLYSEKL